MKRAAATPEGPEPEAKAEPPSVEDTRPDSEILAELGLPDPDTLEPGGNFAAFMAKAVPTRLRNRALRRLWLSNPVLANVDGLVDYGGDFTDSAMVIENLQTAYQVGKGFVDRFAEMADDPESDPVAPGDAEADEGPEIAAADEAEADAEPDHGAESHEAEAPEVIAEAPPRQVSAPLRRMKFRLTED